MNVLVPDDWGGLQIVDLDQLVGALLDDSNKEEAVANSAFDSIEPSGLTPEGAAKIARVRALNASTEDRAAVEAYWAADE